MTRTAPDGLFENTKPGGNLHLPDFPKTAPGAALIQSSQMVYLRTQDTGQYVNINSSGWAILQANQGCQFVLVQYYAYHYIVVANLDWQGYYLSYNDYSYVGAYKAWDRASYWSVDPVDCAPYPGLYPYGQSGASPYLCCNGVKDAIDKLVTVVSY
jgi:hypothetical protein